MTKKPDLVISALRDLHKIIAATGPAATTLHQQYGWNFAPLDREDLARLALSLAAKLETVDQARITVDYDENIYVSRIELFKANTLPQFWSGNGAAAVPVYFQLLKFIESDFQHFFVLDVDWEKLEDQRKIPKAMATRLRSFHTRIERLDVDFASLDAKIRNINEAHQAANELPTDLENLRVASEEVSETREITEKNKILSEDALRRVQDLLSLVESHEKEAKKLVENTEDAYSAATTKGLGEAFQKRADRLANSMWIWVAGLLLALVAGAIIGTHRIGVLQGLLAQDASEGKIALNLILAFVTVAAPIWFAWIATKQIGHRFRLSEDYAFKASVAQAYEGYRREAARLDDSFAKRLFSSALDRIDEAPIRFVEHETHGSPWHELFGGRRRSPAKPRGEAQLPIKLPTNAPESVSKNGSDSAAEATP